MMAVPSLSISTPMLIHNKTFSTLFFQCHMRIPSAIKFTKPASTFYIRSSKHVFSLNAATTAFENEEEYYDDVEEEEVFDDEEEQEQEDEDEVSVEGRRLYVGNLPYTMTSLQLTELFGEAGRVTSVEIVYDRLTDRSRGFAFITMGSIEDAKQAIRMFDGSLVGRRTLKVNFPEIPRGGEKEVMGPRINRSYRGFIESPHKIYAGNLGWNLNSEGLQEAFANQHGLLSAKIIYDRNSGKSKGFGFITFSTKEDAISALNAMNGMDLEGRPLRLNVATRREMTEAPQS